MQSLLRTRYVQKESSCTVADAQIRVRLFLMLSRSMRQTSGRLLVRKLASQLRLDLTPTKEF